MYIISLKIGFYSIIAWTNEESNGACVMFRNLLSKYTIHNISLDRLDINVPYKIMSDDDNRKPLKKIMSNIKGPTAYYSLKRLL